MSHLQQLADSFLRIFDTHRPGEGTPASLQGLSIEQAYAVQRRVIDARVARGERAVGYKVGCTSRAIQQQFGLCEPICGRLLEPHLHHGETTLSQADFHGCAVEPEFVLRMGRDVDREVSATEPLVDAIDCVAPGVEVHNYHFWFGEPTLQELIASNGIHACLVIGEQRTAPGALDWDMEGVDLFVNGERIASGTGAEILGGPMRSLRWLANHLLRRGEHLRAGDWVIPGSPVRLVRVEAGQRVEARFTHAGSVTVHFAASPASGAARRSRMRPAETPTGWGDGGRHPIPSAGGRSMQATEFIVKKSLDQTGETTALTDREKHLIGLAVSLTRGCQVCTGRRLEEALQAGIPYETVRAAIDLSAAVNAGVVLRTALEGAQRNKIDEICEGPECTVGID